MTIFAILVCLVALAWAAVLLALIGLVYKGWPKDPKR